MRLLQTKPTIPKSESRPTKGNIYIEEEKSKSEWRDRSTKGNIEKNRTDRSPLVGRPKRLGRLGFKVAVRLNWTALVGFAEWGGIGGGVQRPWALPVRFARFEFGLKPTTEPKTDPHKFKNGSRTETDILAWFRFGLNMPTLIYWSWQFWFLPKWWISFIIGIRHVFGTMRIDVLDSSASHQLLNFVDYKCSNLHSSKTSISTGIGHHLYFPFP